MFRFIKNDARNLSQTWTLFFHRSQGRINYGAKRAMAQGPRRKGAHATKEKIGYLIVIYIGNQFMDIYAKRYDTSTVHGLFRILEWERTGAPICIWHRAPKSLIRHWQECGSILWMWWNILYGFVYNLLLFSVVEIFWKSVNPFTADPGKALHFTILV